MIIKLTKIPIRGNGKYQKCDKMPSLCQVPGITELSWGKFELYLLYLAFINIMERCLLLFCKTYLGRQRQIKLSILMELHLR